MIEERDSFHRQVSFCIMANAGSKTIFHSCKSLFCRRFHSRPLFRYFLNPSISIGSNNFRMIIIFCFKMAGTDITNFCINEKIWAWVTTPEINKSGKCGMCVWREYVSQRKTPMILPTWCKSWYWQRPEYNAGPLFWLSNKFLEPQERELQTACMINIFYM